MPMQAELEAIIARFEADTGTIHLIEDGVLMLEAHAGVPQPVIEVVARVPIGKGMAGQAAERNEVVTSCNIQVDKTGSVQPGARESGVNGAVVVPIRDGAGRAVGALGIGVHREHEYSDADVAKLLEEARRLAPNA